MEGIRLPKQTSKPVFHFEFGDRSEIRAGGLFISAAGQPHSIALVDYEV